MRWGCASGDQQPFPISNGFSELMGSGKAHFVSRPGKFIGNSGFRKGTLFPPQKAYPKSKLVKEQIICIFQVNRGVEQPGSSSGS